MKPVDSKGSFGGLFFLKCQVVIKVVWLACYAVLLLPAGSTRHLEADTAASCTAESLELYRNSLVI